MDRNLSAATMFPSGTAIGLNNSDGTDGAGYFYDAGSGLPAKAGDGTNNWALRFYGGTLPVEMSVFGIE